MDTVTIKKILECSRFLPPPPNPFLGKIHFLIFRKFTLRRVEWRFFVQLRPAVLEISGGGGQNLPPQDVMILAAWK